MKNKKKADSYILGNADPGNGEITVKKSRRLDILAIAGCIIMAIILWFYVIGNSSSDFERIIYSVPVNVVNTGSLSVLSGTGTSVDVTVKGKRSDVTKLTASDIQAEVNVSDITQAGRYKMSVSVTPPSGITLGSVSPSNVSIYLDTTSTISVPVQINLTDYILLDGYELNESDATANITDVKVTGPESALADVEAAQVTVHLGTVTSSVSYNGTIELINKNGDVINNPYVKMQTSSVTVSVPVYRYADIPIQVKYKYGYYNTSNAIISCEPETIRIKGETAAIENAECSVTLDEKQIASDTNYTFKIALSDGLTNVDKIETATLKIVHVGTTTASFNVSNITVNNPNRLNYRIETESLNVTLRGTAEALSALEADDIIASVDLSSLSNSSGTMTLPVTISVPSGDEANKTYEIGTYSVSVRIING